MNRGWIVDRSTGKEYRSRFNFKEMAEAPGDPYDIVLYDELYTFLSSVTHIDLSDMSLYFSEEDGYFHQGHTANVVEAPFVAVMLCAMLFSELSNSPQLSALSRRDAAFFSKRASKKLLGIEGSPLAALPECKRRLQAIL